MSARDLPSVALNLMLEREVTLGRAQSNSRATVGGMMLCSFEVLRVTRSYGLSLSMRDFRDGKFALLERRW